MAQELQRIGAGGKYTGDSPGSVESAGVGCTGDQGIPDTIRNNYAVYLFFLKTSVVTLHAP